MSAGTEMLFIFAGLFWCGLMLIFLAAWAGLNRIRTPKQRVDNDRFRR